MTTLPYMEFQIIKRLQLRSISYNLHDMKRSLDRAIEGTPATWHNNESATALLFIHIPLPPTIPYNDFLYTRKRIEDAIHQVHKACGSTKPRTSGYRIILHRGDRE